MGASQQRFSPIQDTKEEQSAYKKPEDPKGLEENMHEKDGWRDAIDANAADVNEIRERSDAMQKDIEKYNLRLSNVLERLDKAEDGLAADRIQTIQILAFFVAFFTFVSVEFQLFAHLTTIWEYMTVTLILFGCLVFFTTLFSKLLKGSRAESLHTIFKIKKLRGYRLLLLASAFIVVGIVVAGIESAVQANDSFAKKQEEACSVLLEKTVPTNDAAEVAVIKEKYDFLQCNAQQAK